MDLISLISNSNSETMLIAKTIAKYLNNGDTIVLTGNLGSR